MYKEIKPIYVIAETPLHAGSGSDVGIVDLPIQREKHTDFPKIQGSEVKGCIRNAFRNMNKDLIIVDKEVISTKLEKYESNRDKTIELVFGPEESGDFQGAIGFTDARILLFPVKSMRGVFTWITCPYVLNRYKKEMELAGKRLTIKDIPIENTVPEKCEIFVKDNKIVLEEYTYDMNGDDNCTKLAQELADLIFPIEKKLGFWNKKLRNNLVVLSNDDFKEFVNMATEVITRTRINPKTGTVQSRALFTEEYLPGETVMYTLALSTEIKQEEGKRGIFDKITTVSGAKVVMGYVLNNIPETMQIGGSQTIGKGLVRIETGENNDSISNK